MTKRRPPVSFADAVTRVAGQLPGAWAEAAGVVGKSERAVRNWSDPDTGTTPSIEECLLLDAAFLRATGAAGGVEAPFLSVYALKLEALVHPATGRAALCAAAGEAVRAAGKFSAQLFEATQPGAPPRVVFAAQQEGLDLIADTARAVQELTKVQQEG